MRRFVATLVLVGTVTLSPFAGFAGSNGHEATPISTPMGCPVTQPNASGTMPDDFDAPGGFRNDSLWTNLWMWGENGVILPPGDGHITEDGAFIELKWAWYRFEAGKLEITGRRLDAPAAPLEAWIPDGYGDTGFQVSGITFPTAGCWEVTGHLGDATLTFVLWVAVGDPVWPDYTQSTPST